MSQEINKKNETMFFAIIGAYVRYDKRLTSNHKVLYAEITALTHKSGYCYASNSHFADMFNVHKNTISNWVSKLKECGHIKYFIDKKADGNFIRKIHLTNKIPLGAKSKDLPPSIPALIPLNPTMNTPKSEDGQIHISNKIINKIEPTGSASKEYSILLKRVMDKKSIKALNSDYPKLYYFIGLLPPRLSVFEIKHCIWFLGEYRAEWMDKPFLYKHQFPSKSIDSFVDSALGDFHKYYKYKPNRMLDYDTLEEKEIKDANAHNLVGYLKILEGIK